jgi:hypothetical protein
MDEERHEFDEISLRVLRVFRRNRESFAFLKQ